MGINRVIVDSQSPNIYSANIAVTTAGTTVLIPSIGTNSIYITDIIVSNGVTAGSFILGSGTGAVAPTTTAISIQSVYIGATTTTSFLNLGTPIKINTNNNFLATALSCTTLSITALYYVNGLVLRLPFIR